jgi:hypothetical protein
VSDGGKSWLLRYMFNGRARHMGLGRVSIVSLHEARISARAARLQVRNGIDPIDERRQQRAKALASTITFKAAALKVMASREAKWRNPEHRRQWRTSLEHAASHAVHRTNLETHAGDRRPRSPAY